MGFSLGGQHEHKDFPSKAPEPPSEPEVVKDSHTATKCRKCNSEGVLAEQGTEEWACGTIRVEANDEQVERWKISQLCKRLRKYTT